MWASKDDDILLLDSLSNMIPSHEDDASDSPKIHKDDPNSWLKPRTMMIFHLLNEKLFACGLGVAKWNQKFVDSAGQLSKS